MACTTAPTYTLCIEESGEQCIVVLVIIVTEPASECVGVDLPAGSVRINAKTTVQCFPDSSMILCHTETVTPPSPPLPPQSKVYQLTYTGGLSDNFVILVAFLDD
jgi:hypothetical protein